MSAGPVQIDSQTSKIEKKTIVSKKRKLQPVRQDSGLNKNSKRKGSPSKSDRSSTAGSSFPSTAENKNPDSFEYRLARSIENNLSFKSSLWNRFSNNLEKDTDGLEVPNVLQSKYTSSYIQKK